MRSPASRFLRRWLRVCVLASCASVLPAPAWSETGTAAEATAEARTLVRQEWQTRIRWIGATRIGLLHVVAADSFHTFDLLDAGRRLSSVPLPAGSVVPLPIPASNIVLVPRARSGLLAGRVPDRAKDTLSSYAFDAFSGRILWERPPLPERLGFEYVPEAGVLLAAQLKAPLLEAIDPATGEILWRLEAEGWRVHVRGRYADVVGEEARLLDIRSGTVLLRYRMPLERSQDLAFLSSPDRIVVRTKKAFLGYRLPPLPEAEGDRTAGAAGRDTVLEPAWTWSTPAAASFRSFAPVSGDRLALRAWSGTFLLDGITGRSPWSNSDPDARILPSPDGKRAAAWAGSRITLFDLESGTTDVRRLPAPSRRIDGKVTGVRWLDDDQLLLCYGRNRNLMTGMSVFSTSRRTQLWQSGATFPEVQFCPLTEEKVAATLKTVGTLTSAFAPIVTAAMGANPMMIFMNPIFEPFVGPAEGIETFNAMITLGAALSATGSLADVAMRSRLQPRDQVSRWPFLDGEVGIALPALRPASGDTAAAVAWRRFESHRDLVKAMRTGIMTSMGGEDDQYRVVEQDFLVPTQRTIAVYHRKSVNGMGLLLPYPLAVSVEDDQRTVRILSLDGDPSPAPPELLPPSR